MPTRSEQLLSLDEVSDLLRYDPATGHLFWRKKVSHTGDERGKPGSRAGTRTSKGYIQVTINKKTYCAHRIGWLLATGTWPSNTIDHINGERADNRFSNLRPATGAQQQGNRPHNKSGRIGERGLTWIDSDARWQVSLAGKYLGRFKNKEEAVAVFEQAAREKYGAYYIKDSRNWRGAR